MSSFLNSNYFQAILDSLGGGSSTISTVWGMIRQCFYALAGCILGAIVFANYGALIGTIIGAVIGFRSVKPYHSLLSQLQGLNNRQKQHLIDEIKHTVGSSSVDNLLGYAMEGRGRQMIFDIVQRFLNNNPPQQPQNNAGFFSRIFS